MELRAKLVFAVLAVIALSSCGNDWKVKSGKSEMTDQLEFIVYRESANELNSEGKPYRPTLVLNVANGTPKLTFYSVLGPIPCDSEQRLLVRLDEDRAFTPPNRCDWNTSSIEMSTELIGNMLRAKNMKLEFQTRRSGRVVAEFPLGGLQGALNKLCSQEPGHCDGEKSPKLAKMLRPGGGIEVSTGK